VAAGWNKPAKLEEEETVERLRKSEDGTCGRLGSDCNSGLLRWCREKGRNLGR